MRKPYKERRPVLADFRLNINKEACELAGPGVTGVLVEAGGRSVWITKSSRPLAAGAKFMPLSSPA